MTEQIRMRNAETYQKRLGSREVRRRTLDAAQRLFAERGIAAVSVREIAREVGVSHTLLHLYFGEKDQILREVLQRGYAEGGGSADNKSAVELMRVLAAALAEGVVPDGIGVDFAEQSALSKQLFEGQASKDSVTDPRIVDAAITCMALGWAVSSAWLCREPGLAGLSADDIAAGIAGVVKGIAE